MTPLPVSDARIGYGQVIVGHHTLEAHIDFGALLVLMFDRMEMSIDIDRVSIGICPDLASTWFRFQGPWR